jgi:D-alanyl-lipoteichoic acid acyltransferase DltB (MBOAT superfamily)
MIWGLFKKVVIADNLAGLVNTAYTNPEDHTGMTLLLTSYFFAFQIYCDFSGYSDMAIGAARVMGYDLMENFRTPYLSASIKEFWSRWHISLSSWFRDYLYIPLGGNRVGKSRWLLNLFLVFLISGIWHGANWTYVVWGALHGIFLMFAIVKDDFLEKRKIKFLKNNKLLHVLNVFITLQLVCFAWIFFRANSIQDATTIIHKIGYGEYSIQTFIESISALADNPKNFSRILFIMLLMGIFYVIDPFVDKIIKGKILLSKPYMKYLLYSFMVASIILFGFFGEVSFIYFQF